MADDRTVGHRLTSRISRKILNDVLYTRSVGHPDEHDVLALSGRTNRCALVRPAATHTARRFGRIFARERAYLIHLVARPVPPSVSPPLARPARRVRTASRAPRRCRIREALASIWLGLGALVLSTRDASPSGGRGEEARASRRPMALRHHPDAPRRHPAPRVPPAASASRRGRAALGALGRAPGIPPVLSLASDPDDPDDHDDPDEHIPLEELAELEALVSSAVAALDDADASPAPRGSRLFAGGASLAPDAVLREAGPGVADVLVVRAAREKRDAPSLTDETVDDLSSHLTPRQRAMIRRAIRRHRSGAGDFAEVVRARRAPNANDASRRPSANADAPRLRRDAPSPRDRPRARSARRISS